MNLYTHESFKAPRNITNNKYSLWSKIKSIDEDTGEVLNDQLVELDRVPSYELGIEERDKFLFDTYERHVGYDESGPVYETCSCKKKPIRACRFDGNGVMIRTRESFHISTTKVRDGKKSRRAKNKALT